MSKSTKSYLIIPSVFAVKKRFIKKCQNWKWWSITFVCVCVCVDLFGFFFVILVCNNFPICIIFSAFSDVEFVSGSPLWSANNFKSTNKSNYTNGKHFPSANRGNKWKKRVMERETKISIRIIHININCNIIVVASKSLALHWFKSVQSVCKALIAPLTINGTVLIAENSVCAHECMCEKVPNSSELSFYHHIDRGRDSYYVNMHTYFRAGVCMCVTKWTKQANTNRVMCALQRPWSSYCSLLLSHSFLSHSLTLALKSPEAWTHISSTGLPFHLFMYCVDWSKTLLMPFDLKGILHFVLSRGA